MTEISSGIFDNYNGVNIHIFKIQSSGITANILTYGALLQSLYVPDRNGAFDDITTGFDSINEYNQKGRKDGSIMGRYAGRISNVSFILDDQVLNLFFTVLKIKKRSTSFLKTTAIHQNTQFTAANLAFTRKFGLQKSSQTASS